MTMRSVIQNAVRAVATYLCRVEADGSSEPREDGGYGSPLPREGLAETDGEGSRCSYYECPTCAKQGATRPEKARTI